MALNHERNLLLNKNKEQQQLENKEDFDIPTRKLTPTKFILPIETEESYTKPLENYENVTLSNFNNVPNNNNNKRTEYRKSAERLELEHQKLNTLRTLKKEKLQTIAKFKRQMAEMEIQTEELNREVSIS